MARDSIRCSFCGKRQEQVGRIIAGPNVYICNECVELCSDRVPHGGLNGLRFSRRRRQQTAREQDHDEQDP